MLRDLWINGGWDPVLIPKFLREVFPGKIADRRPGLARLLQRSVSDLERSSTCEERLAPSAHHLLDDLVHLVQRLGHLLAQRGELAIPIASVRRRLGEDSLTSRPWRESSRLTSTAAFSMANVFAMMATSF
ncbi:MAG TPA: hypothetical protein VIY29_29225 [Ktedonobacteraceae bacterium]